MKTYSFKQLHDENPELLATVVRGMLFVIPQISKHVQETLNALGGIVEHASFMRFLNDDQKTMFVELVMWFDKYHIDKPFLKEIIFYENQKTYDAKRKETEQKAVSEFGEKLGTTQYGGKFIGKF